MPRRESLGSMKFYQRGCREREKEEGDKVGRERQRATSSEEQQGERDTTLLGRERERDCEWAKLIS